MFNNVYQYQILTLLNILYITVIRANQSQIVIHNTIKYIQTQIVLLCTNRSNIMPPEPSNLRRRPIGHSKLLIFATLV